MPNMKLSIEKINRLYVAEVEVSSTVRSSNKRLRGEKFVDVLNQAAEIIYEAFPEERPGYVAPTPQPVKARIEPEEVDTSDQEIAEEEQDTVVAAPKQRVFTTPKGNKAKVVTRRK